MKIEADLPGVASVDVDLELGDADELQFGTFYHSTGTPTNTSTNTSTNTTASTSGSASVSAGTSTSKDSFRDDTQLQKWSWKVLSHGMKRSEDMNERRNEGWRRRLEEDTEKEEEKEEEEKR